MTDTYTHGHHESVLRSHSWRTVENSAAYLIPELKQGRRLLDVGCGPGTITVELAERLDPGEVLGIDSSPAVIERARAAAREREAPSSLQFAIGDAYDLRAQGLDIEAASFDIVHAHQVLQHLTDPVAALREWRRILVPDGVVAARDSDYSAGAISPDDPLLDRWRELYSEITRANRAEANAGRYLKAWAQQAGFGDVRLTSSTWTFADPVTCNWWGELWAERVLSSSFADQALSYGLSDQDELDAIASAWRRWGAAEDAAIFIVAGEILARD